MGGQGEEGREGVKFSALSLCIYVRYIQKKMVLLQIVKPFFERVVNPYTVEKIFLMLGQFKQAYVNKSHYTLVILSL